LTGPTAGLSSETVKVSILVPLLPSITCASAIETLASSLRMVPTPVPSPIARPVALVSVRLIVSSISLTPSPRIVTSTCFDVSPGWNVSDPVVAR
jgi:hypothetical protein